MWDYVTVDSQARRVYIPRQTHIMVIDADSGKLIADVPGMTGIHGVAVAKGFNRGFVTGNKSEKEGTVFILDLNPLKLVSSIPSKSYDTDSLEYDPFTKHVFINNGDAMNLTVVDAATDKVVGTMPFPGDPEAAASDEKGSMFQDLVDKGQVIEYDAKSLKITHTWPSAPCAAPASMAMDRAHRRLFVGCRGEGNAPGVLIVMNADTGHVMTSMPIAIGVDGTVFDPETSIIYATCRDSGDGKTGTTFIFHADSPDKISLVAKVSTIYGARTAGLDTKTHHMFTVGTEQNLPPAPGARNNRLRPVPSTFELVEIGK